MPTYEYECDGCSHSFNVFQSITEKKIKKCPKCNKNTLHRLIGTGGGLIFKGSGFYETDYKNKSDVSSKNSKVEPEACKSCSKSEVCGAN